MSADNKSRPTREECEAICARVYWALPTRGAMNDEIKKLAHAHIALLDSYEQTIQQLQADKERTLKMLEELHDFNECALCYDDGDCKFANFIDAARGVQLASSAVFVPFLRPINRRRADPKG